MHIYRGTLKSFDAGTYLATVDIQGSHLQWLAGIPTNRAIAAAEMVAARTVAVIFFDSGNPSDAMVLGIF